MRGVYGKSQLITFNQPAWRTKREIAGGGVLLDQGIHMIDLMRLFGGDFLEVFSFVSNNHWGHDVEDNAYALMKTDKGVVAMLHSSATQWKHQFNLEINLQKGSIILGGILSGSKSYGEETLNIITADPDNDAGDPIEHKTRYNKDPSWDAELTSFIKSILTDAPVRSGNSKDALECMKLVNKIYTSDLLWKNQFNIID
jgi:predicted dehydrogenase